MTKGTDLFAQINNAVLDLQCAQDQTFERPLKTLARLLNHPDLVDINQPLKANVDFDAFVASSEETGGSFMGSSRLLWPEEPEACLGLTLTLVDRMAANPGVALGIGHNFFYSGTKVIAGFRTLVGQLLVPFARDYKVYVLSRGAAPRLSAPTSNKVFIVHGHDDAALHSLARFLEKLGLEALILRELPNQGRTIIEKFEHSARDVGFAVILLTPDDLGGVASREEQSARARQNVIFELGYFAGALGRGRVCLLRRGDVEIPSDLFGVVYTEMDAAEGWKPKLAKELKAASIEFDANRVWD